MQKIFRIVEACQAQRSRQSIKQQNEEVSLYCYQHQFSPPAISTESHLSVDSNLRSFRNMPRGTV